VILHPLDDKKEIYTRDSACINHLAGNVKGNVRARVLSKRKVILKDNHYLSAVQSTAFKRTQAVHNTGFVHLGVMFVKESYMFPIP